MKHKHYEMIVAKAANMDLETFIKQDGEWRAMVNAFPMSEHFDYFLCLPQHKEACLHWLNGGELYINNGKGLGEGYYTLGIKTHKPLVDFTAHPEYEFRIKPKKEKRLIVVRGDKVEFAKNGLLYPESAQLIEIEVEA